MTKRKGNYKAGPGRPKGKLFPIRIMVQVTKQQREWLFSKFDNVSEGIRTLIDADMGKHKSTTTADD